jgi:hypothetical protein
MAVFQSVCQKRGSPAIVSRLARPVQRSGSGGFQSAKASTAAVRMGPAWKRTNPSSQGAMSR